MKCPICLGEVEGLPAPGIDGIRLCCPIHDLYTISGTAQMTMAGRPQLEWQSEWEKAKAAALLGEIPAIYASEMPLPVENTELDPSKRQI